jgi:hypothetical protein
MSIVFGGPRGPWDEDERDRIEQTGMTDWERETDRNIRAAVTARREAFAAFEADPTPENRERLRKADQRRRAAEAAMASE